MKKAKHFRIRRHSLRTRLVLLWTGMTVLIMSAVLFIALCFVISNKEDEKKTGLTIAESAAERLSQQVVSLRETTDTIFTGDVNFRKIASGNLDDYDYIGAVNQISVTMAAKVASLSYMGGMFCYDPERGLMRAKFSSSESSTSVYRLVEEVIPASVQDAGGKRHYSLISCGEETFLCYAISYRGTCLGFLINATEILSVSGREEYFLSLSGGEPVQCAGESLLSASGLTERLSHDTMETGKIIVSGAEVAETDLKLLLVRDVSSGLTAVRALNWIVALLIPLLLFSMMLIVLRYMDQLLNMPVNYLRQRLSRETGKAETAAADLAEYQEINQKIDEILDRIEALREEKYREELRANSAELQYLQLQVNPHFFLNCLNTISSLLESDSKNAAEDLMLALSHHFRYVFKDNRQLRPLREEIAETQDYCRIYTIKGGIPIYLNINISEEVTDWPVPGLIIQTFAENSIKYGRSGNGLLTIRLLASAETVEGERMLSIRISDNGSGFPQERLKELNSPIDLSVFPSRHVGIFNLKARLFLRFGDRASVHFYNLPQSGGIVQILIPEVKEE